MLKSTLPLLLLMMLVSDAFATDQETLIRKRVQLRVILAQTQFCSSELYKLQSKSATPFMLNQSNPAETNRRFSDNKLSLEEEIGYNEFSEQCAIAFALTKSLSEELKKKP